MNISRKIRILLLRGFWEVINSRFGVEISWGERIFGYNIQSIAELSIQGETNLHNLPFFHNYFLDPALQIICIFLGWVGWRKWPYLNSLPSRKFSLFFLIVSLYFFYLMTLYNKSNGYLSSIKKKICFSSTRFK